MEKTPAILRLVQLLKASGVIGDSLMKEIKNIEGVILFRAIKNAEDVVISSKFKWSGDWYVVTTDGSIIIEKRFITP